MDNAPRKDTDGGPLPLTKRSGVGGGSLPYPSFMLRAGHLPIINAIACGEVRTWFKKSAADSCALYFPEKWTLLIIN